MRFLHRVLQISWIAKKSNETGIQEVGTIRSVINGNKQTLDNLTLSYDETERK